MAQQGSLAQAVSDLNEDQIKALVKQKLDAGTPATEILAECHAGLVEVGNRFEQGRYFISELMYAGEIMKDLTADLGPMLEDLAPEGHQPKSVVLGTVRGDVHDIGKDIVALMLRGAGFRVTDLGVDVAPEKFVAAVRDTRPVALGMSVFLTSCCKAVEQTVQALRQAGLRDGLSIMIGGAAASNLVAERTGCDYYGETAVHAVRHAASVAGSG